MDLQPFALLTQDFILLPTPWAADVLGYRTLFRKLHADPVFCLTAFGPNFKPLIWNDDEVRQFFQDRDIALRWKRRGMGDFGIGILKRDVDGRTAWDRSTGKSVTWSTGKDEFRAITGEDFGSMAKGFDALDWVGYTCVRDATSSGTWEDQNATLPWQEMIEIRYGMDSGFRGKGIATRATEVVMHWATVEKGAKRFIAETEKDNAGSQKLLTRLGFARSATAYFGGEGFEWTESADLVGGR